MTKTQKLYCMAVTLNSIYHPSFIDSTCLDTPHMHAYGKTISNLVVFIEFMFLTPANYSSIKLVAIYNFGFSNSSISCNDKDP